MHYYLVNYLILEDKKVLINEHIYISLYNFANTNDFKQTIAGSVKSISNPESIVIKSYKQVTLEEYNGMNALTA